MYSKMPYSFDQTQKRYKVLSDNLMLSVLVHPDDQCKLIPQKNEYFTMMNSEWSPDYRIPQDEKNLLFLYFLKELVIDKKNITVLLLSSYEHPLYDYWVSWCNNNIPSGISVEVSNAIIKKFRKPVDWFDPNPFGEELMQKVGLKLMTGIDLAYHHNYYCGHGLLYDNGIFTLGILDDGVYVHTLKSWESLSLFVNFFAPLTDYICSGADYNHPVFYTEDDWYFSNQRISKSRLIDFIK